MVSQKDYALDFLHYLRWYLTRNFVVSYELFLYIEKKWTFF